MATRLGVDVGGTFSDLVWYDDETGEVGVAKGSSTPEAPDEAVVSVIGAAIAPEVLARAEFFLHGSTVALNALLERNGATIGLLTTEGFRDVLELRRGDREAMYDLRWKPPAALVPRRLRLEVRERILSDGALDIPLNEEDVVRALSAFRAEGVECIAVVFINAYADPRHELEAERVLREGGFEGEIALSHCVSGEYREFERTSTTVVDAYIRPVVSGYLRRLERSLHDEGFGGVSLVTTSGGGALTFEEAGERPVESLMSGPAAGAVGAGALCRELGVETAVAADVGGTSFDTCLISHGRPATKYQGQVLGMPVQMAWVDVRSIGAGGGSVAYVDDGGLLRVGPRSAGADPGPACYGRGGTVPTVTDAAAELGMLPQSLAGGLALDLSAARSSLEPLAVRLGLGPDDLARGVLTIATAAMANAIREVTIEEGHDPREAALIAYGGAGPLFATLLAAQLGMGTVVVPRHAGNFSAWGLLAQDVTRSASMTLVRPLDDAGLVEASAAAKTLLDRLARAVQVHPSAEAIAETALDLRFAGQEYTLTVPVELAHGRIPRVGAVHATFAADYLRSFRHVLQGPVEIVAVRAFSRTPLPERRRTSTAAAASAVAAAERATAFSFAAGGRCEFAIVDRALLGRDAQLEGPAIVVEPTATTYVDSGWRVDMHEGGAMLMRRPV